MTNEDLGEVKSEKEVRTKVGISSFWGLSLVFLFAVVAGAAVWYFAVLAPKLAGELEQKGILAAAKKDKNEVNINEISENSGKVLGQTDAKEWQTYISDYFNFKISYPDDFSLTTGKNLIFESSDFSTLAGLNGAKITVFFDANEDGVKPEKYWRLASSDFKAENLVPKTYGGSEAVLFEVGSKEANAGALISNGKIMYRFEALFEKNKFEEYFKLFDQMLSTVNFK